MLYNLRAKCVNKFGASIIYTWRGIDCESEAAAHTLARSLAEEVEKIYCYQAKEIVTSLPSDETLRQEDDEHIRDKAALELFAGGYDES